MISNVLIGLGVIALILVIKKVIDDKKDDDKEDKPVAQASTIPDLPIGRWCYIDEGIDSLTHALTVESNGAQDLMASLALAISARGTKPAFVGVSCSPEGVTKDAIVEIMRATALNVPVFEGAPEYSAVESELGQAIISESEKGLFTIALGSPAGDIEWAFKNGAHTHNITMYALLRNTWNAEGNNGMPHYQRSAMEASAKYVAQILGARLHEIERPDYYHLTDVNNLPAQFKDTAAFIGRHRDLRAWDLANSNNVLNRNATLNRVQNLSTGQLRIADVLAVAQMVGISWRDANGIMSGIEHGLAIMKDRIANGAVNNIDYPAAIKPESVPVQAVNRSTFNEAACKVYGGTQNPLRFNQTANITHGKITESSYEIKHSKDRVWKGKQYQPNRFIDGTDGVISYNRADSSWYVYMFEYSLTGEDRRPKGWRDAQWILKGDPVGLISSTNTRNGEWNVAGQANERSNIHWVTA